MRRWLWRGIVAGSLLVCLAAVTAWGVFFGRSGRVWWTRMDRMAGERELPHEYYVEAALGRLTLGEQRYIEPTMRDGSTFQEYAAKQIEQAEGYALEQLAGARKWHEPKSFQERSIAEIEQRRDADVAKWRALLEQYEKSMEWAKPGFHAQRRSPPAPASTRMFPHTWEWGGIRYRYSIQGDARSSSLLVPMWMVVAAAALLPFVAAVGVARRARRRRKGWCLRCGYDLRASAGGCPECGAGRAEMAPTV